MHERVQQVIDIRRRRPDGVFALEGLWAIRHAVDASIAIEVLIVCPTMVRGPATTALVAELRTSGTEVVEVGERVLRRLVDRDGPDGLAAVARMPRHDLADISVGTATRVVIADGLDLPGNLGTVIRCADGAGASAVVQTDRRVRANHPVVVKASMGTVFSMPVVDATRNDTHAWLRRHGFRVIGADPHATVSYREADFDGPIAIVLGSERHGLDPFWRDGADVLVSIPMLGVADSLNVGHAAALLLYEAALPRTRATQPGSSSRSSSAHSSRRWPADG